MSDRHASSTCQLCHNQCAVTLNYDEVGIVYEAWCDIPAHNGIEQKACQQLNEVLGKNVDKALRRISHPALGAYLAGGH